MQTTHGEVNQPLADRLAAYEVKKIRTLDLMITSLLSRLIVLHPCR